MLTIRRVELPTGAEAQLRRLLRLAGRQPNRSLHKLLSGLIGPAELRDLGIDPAMPAGLVRAADWRAIAVHPGLIRS